MTALNEDLLTADAEMLFCSSKNGLEQTAGATLALLTVRQSDGVTFSSSAP